MHKYHIFFYNIYQIIYSVASFFLVMLSNSNGYKLFSQNNPHLIKPQNQFMHYFFYWINFIKKKFNKLLIWWIKYLNTVNCNTVSFWKHVVPPYPLCYSELLHSGNNWQSELRHAAIIFLQSNHGFQYCKQSKSVQFNEFFHLWSSPAQVSCSEGTIISVVAAH